MSGKRGGLGRSLSALLQASGDTSQQTLAQSSAYLLNVAVDALQPSQYQPRRVFDETALTEL